uniref:IQ motif containing with AAA domain 1 n=1 Tax=Crocodylus porosus TaxID=8502 RepID=A0A7M4FUI0_CROPO
MWAEAQEGLNDLLQTEIEDKSPKPLKDRPVVFQMLATFYVKYVQIFRNLETAYDQIVHPQKRLVIRQVLEGVMGRILELKNEMVELENSEFHYFDDILQDQKLCPEHIEIPIPRYFIKEKLKVLKEREKILAQILVNADMQDIEPVMTFKEAIRIIQISERARQGRLRAEFMKQIYLEEKRERQARLHGGKSPNLDASAVCIQKVWRGYIQKKRTEKIRDEEMIFLGMSPPPHFYRISASLMQAQRVEATRCEVQEKHDEEYKKGLVAIKNRLREMEGPDIKESLQDQIRQWFIECRHITGKFPDYPDEEDGGSTVIFSQKTPEQVSVSFSPEKRTECMVAEIRNRSFRYYPNKWLENVWQHREEGWNFHQEYDPELVKEEKRKEVKEEIRVQVCLQQTISSLYKELVEGGLLIKPKTVKLSDYVGEYSYLGTTLRQVDIEPMPSLTDVRQLIALYGILPLGSQVLHEKAPLVKALLLAGPAGVGKKMLVHALCTETGANLFNLSASNIAGKYPGKSGLQMLLNMVFKVAKQLQPSVVWIGDTEKTFYKKVPKAEKEMEPKRLKKNLPKILKSLKAEDRVLIVGTTTRPFDADLRPFCKVFKKIILIPRPDYASRFVLWKHIILQNGGSLSKSPTISCLAKMSDGFTQGHIIYAAQTVLTERRTRQLNRKPLTAVELMGALARQDPVYKEEEDMFKVKLTC